MDSAPVSTPIISKNKGGAPPSFIWKFFGRLEQCNKKTNRYRAQCSFCQHVVEDGRVEHLHRHVLRACPVATTETKQYVQAELDKKLEQAANPSRKASKREAGQTPNAAHANKARPITDHEQEEHDIKLLRFLIMSGLPFTAVEMPWVLDFFHSLKPAYVPAGALKLQTSVLTNDYANSTAALDVRLAQEQYVSVSIDVWRSNCSQAAYACDVRLADGTTSLLGAQAVSSDADTAIGASALLMKWVMMLGPAKVASVCTDDVASLAAARSLLPSMPGCSHIVQYRCPMHAFTLLICSMLGFPWAKALVGTAQQMAICYSTDRAAIDSLAAEARQLGLPVHLSPCNLSEVQSVHACLQSLLRMQMAIRQALLKYPGACGQLQPVEGVSSDVFWAQLQSLCSLLAPFAEAIALVQSRAAGLADIAIHLLQFVNLLEAAKTVGMVPADFAAHCSEVYCQRMAELDGELCRLALLLQPKYKLIAVPDGNVSPLMHKARSILQQRGGDEAACNELMTQLQAYLAQASPFDMPMTQVSVKAWWQSLAPNHADLAEIVSLGVFMCDLAPHAASVERLSCLMGWYHTPVVSSLNTETVAMVVALKAHLQRNVPSVSKPLQPQEQGSDGSQLLDLPPLGANVAPEQLMQRLHLFFAQPVASSSVAGEVEQQSDLLLAAQCNLNRPALLLGAEPQAAQAALASMPAPRVNANEIVRAWMAS